MPDPSSTVPPVPDSASQTHPALDRFLALPHSGERLLVVDAPPCTGAQQFAHGWAGRPDRVLRWEPQQARWTNGHEIISRVGALLEEDDAGRVAVVAGPGAPVGHLAAAFPARTVNVRDMLLTEAEIRALASQLMTQARASTGTGGDRQDLPPPPLPLTPQRIHRLTGGWLVPATILLTDPRGFQAAERSLYSGLRQWLYPRDAEGIFGQVAYLPALTEQVIDRFSPRGLGPLPSMGELEALGLIVRDATSGWFMPPLVRTCLRDSMQEDHPRLVPELHRAAEEALSAAGEVEAAVGLAVRGRAWRRLWDLLLEYWPDLYVQNAPALAAAVKYVPRVDLGGMDATGMLSRLLSATTADTIRFSPSAAPPDHAGDAVARQLRTTTAKLYRRPDQQALTLGMIEASHLRQTGLFAESADAVLRLKEALGVALGFRRVRPVMAAVVELQAGISLHLADRLAEAETAYEAAYRRAEHGGVDFVLADAAGKLALLCAQQGNTDAARQWLAKVDEPFARLKWGRSLVGFASELARVHIAMTEVDLPAARAVLDRLPAEPDTDEFWASHAALLARVANHAGRSDEAARRMAEWRRERPSAAQSPLAARLFAEAFLAARMGMGDRSEMPGWDQHQSLANLEALRCLLADNPDGALRALRLPVRTGQRHRNKAAIIGVLALSGATPETADDFVVQRLATIHRHGGELEDLAAFHLLGWTPVFRAAGMLDEAEAARLSRLPTPTLAVPSAPVLTPREREVLQSLRAGMSRREMARRTYRSENTIKGQIRSLYAKLGATSAAEAVERARHFGL